MWSPIRHLDVTKDAEEKTGNGINRLRVARIILAALFLFYLFTVLMFTVFSRARTMSIIHIRLFWSFREWMAGNSKMGRQILGNVAMFVPFGYLGTALLPGEREVKRGRKTFMAVLLGGLAFSCLIEGLQLILTRGTFELDDLMTNTLGAVSGYILYRIFGRWKWVTAVAAVFCTLFCAAVLANGTELFHFDPPGSPKSYCFQAEGAENRDGTLLLTGVAFRYNHPEWTGTVVLQSTETGEQITLETEQTERPEVNAYFLCKNDYTMSGFRASGQADPGEEYEIMVRFPLSGLLGTGTYLTGDRIHYAPDREFREPEAEGTELEEIIRKGTLRAFRPDYHCWVYQMDNYLYWITEPGFHFEEDGTTYIQYHLWTTQKEKLPEKRLKNNWFWDNIGGYFEQFEVEGDFGEYRVSIRKIPEEYAITAILTGYYKNKKWVWGEYFRPVYDWQ